MMTTLTRRLAGTVAGAALLSGGLLAASPAEAATATTGTATRTASVRAGAEADAPLLGTLATGQRIPATSTAGGWVQVRFRSTAAYVKADQLTLGTTGLPAAPTAIRKGTKIATVALNVRTGPATARTAVGRVAEGGTVAVTGKVSHGFAEVSYARHLRWVSVRYLATPAAPRGAAAAVAFAKSQLGKPYEYGAAGPEAFDCSGLTSAAWKSAGTVIPRTSVQQFTLGTKVAMADLRPGDLVFFYGTKPSHVAIYVGDGQIIHAPRPGKTVEYSKVSYMPWSGARRPA